MNTRFLVLCLSVSVASVFAQQSPPKAKNTITDNSIVAPESMNQRLGNLLHDWQIDFSTPQDNCSKGHNIIVNDSIYTKRLYALPTQMELSFNQVVKSYIDLYTARRRDLVSYMLTIGDYYFPMFEEELDKQGLPLELKYLPVIESALNPIAVSRVGATGLWQFMLRTGQGYGLEVNSLVDERRDPYKSTEAAVRYLKDLYRIYGDWNLVIAAYNCGPGNVNKAIARRGGKNDYWEIYYYLPRETRGYVPAFIAANYVMNYYAEHNICPTMRSHNMTALDTIHVKEQMHFNQLSSVLGIPVNELKRWNPQFKNDIIPGNFKPYALALPVNKMHAFIAKKQDILDYRKNDFLTHRANTDKYIHSSASGNNLGTTTQNVYYKVKKGDNLSKIAKRNGVTTAQLKSWNRLKSNKVPAGKKIIVKKRNVMAPPASSASATAMASSTETTQKSVNVYYRVRQGDNLSKIAQKNGVTIDQIQSWNGLKSTKISVGKNLIVKKKTTQVKTEPKPTIQQQNQAPEQEKSNVISDYLKNQIDE